MKSFCCAATVLSIYIVLASCNYLGNPHRIRQETRLVTIASPKIEVIPQVYRLTGKKDTVTVTLQMDNIADYKVELGKHKGISLLSNAETSDSNTFKVLLKVNKKAEPGRVHFYIKKESTEHIVAFRFLRQKLAE